MAAAVGKDVGTGIKYDSKDDYRSRVALGPETPGRLKTIEGVSGPAMGCLWFVAYWECH